AVLGRPDHAHQAQLAQLGEDLAGELLLLVPLARVRGQLRLRELADGLLQELLFLAEAEVQRKEPPDAEMREGRNGSIGALVRNRCPRCGAELPDGVPAWVRQLTVREVMTANPV